MMSLHRYAAAWQRRTWATRLLLVEVFFWLGWARLLVLSVPFRWIVGLWGLHAQPLSLDDGPPTPLAAPSSQPVQHTIAAVSPYTPWHSNCLVQTWRLAPACAGVAWLAGLPWGRQRSRARLTSPCVVSQ